MQTPPPPNSEAPLEFARTEFFHIMKQQFYVRMLGISIMGVVTPIFLSLLFQYDSSIKIGTAVVRNIDVIIFIIMVLSFVYAVLSHTYVTQSRRRQGLVRILESIVPKFDEYIHGATVLEIQEPLRSLLIEHVRSRARIWTLINWAILVLPCILGIFTSYLYLYNTDPSDVTGFLIGWWAVLFLLSAIIIYGVARSWAKNRHWKRKRVNLFARVVGLMLLILWLVGVYSLGALEPLRRGLDAALGA